MIFSDPLFLFYFLPVALGIHTLAARSSIELRYRSLPAATLFFLTLAFYGMKEPMWLAPFLLCILGDYGWALLLARMENHRWRRLVCGCSVVQNLLLLAFFKYNPWVESLRGSFSALDPLLPSFLQDHRVLVPPPGLSFYTFESMSFVFDVYRRKIAPPRRPLDYFAFVGMFPRLIAGPIVRYSDMHAQFERYRGPRFEGGLYLLCVGLFYKLAFADQFHLFTPLAFHSDPTVWGAWVGATAFTLELYFDFYGYSLMALGIGQCLGFDFPENFRTPFFSRSVREFWRRWHITLGEWIQNYVFYPIALAPSKRPRLRFYGAVVSTVLIFGVWHGCGVQYVLLGVWFGCVLCFESFFKFPERLPHVLHRPWVLLCITIGWIFLRAESSAQAFTVLKAMAGWGRTGPVDFSLISAHAPSVGVCLVGSAYALFLEERWNVRSLTSVLKRTAIGLAALAIALILGYSSKTVPFLYFQF